jgi:hypothetical protein
VSPLLAGMSYRNATRNIFLGISSALQSSIHLCVSFRAAQRRRSPTPLKGLLHDPNPTSHNSPGASSAGLITIHWRHYPGGLRRWHALALFAPHGLETVPSDSVHGGPMKVSALRRRAKNYVNSFSNSYLKVLVEDSFNENSSPYDCVFAVACLNVLRWRLTTAEYNQFILSLETNQWHTASASSQPIAPKSATLKPLL